MMYPQTMRSYSNVIRGQITKIKINIAFILNVFYIAYPKFHPKKNKREFIFFALLSENQILQ